MFLIKKSVLWQNTGCALSFLKVHCDRTRYVSHLFWKCTVTEHCMCHLFWKCTVTEPVCVSSFLIAYCDRPRYLLAWLISSPNFLDLFLSFLNLFLPGASGGNLPPPPPPPAREWWLVKEALIFWSIGCTFDMGNDGKHKTDGSDSGQVLAWFCK